MRNALFASLSAAALALGGCSMLHSNAIGDPAAGLSSPADVVNNMWYGLYGGAYARGGGSIIAPHQSPMGNATGKAAGSPADFANSIY